jgi:hypothetical protein
LSAAADIEDLVRAAFVQLVVRALVRDELPERSLPALLSTLTPKHRPPVFSYVPHAVHQLVRRADALVQRTPIGVGTCLFRSLARYAALRQARVDASLCIGVAPDHDAASRDGDGFVAHAWVEVGGRPLFEASPLRYQVTYRFPDDRAVSPVSTL